MGCLRAMEKAISNLKEEICKRVLFGSSRDKMRVRRRKECIVLKMRLEIMGWILSQIVSNTAENQPHHPLLNNNLRDRYYSSVLLV